VRILLINPITRAEDPPSYFPLGLAYISGALRQDGHELEILDINAHRWLPPEVEAKLRVARFDWVGITGLITEYNQLCWLISTIRTHHQSTKIVLGGPLASSLPDFMLQSTEADIVVRGEGELTVKEMARAMQDGGDLREIPGLVLKHNGKVHHTSARAPLLTLDDLPAPDWDLFPVEKYLHGEKVGFEFPARTLNIISSRGCPYRCTYCFHGVFGYKFRYRSPENIVAEIVWLRVKFNLDGIVFSDDLFVTSKKRVKRFCDLMIQQKVDIRWMVNARVNLIDEELLRRMKTAGCQAVFFGIESGSQKILDSLQKGVTVEQAERAIKLCKRLGLWGGGYLMIGAPGETKETIRETVEFCRRAGLKAQFAYAVPLPETPWFQMAQASGRIKRIEVVLDSWVRWSDKFTINMTDMDDDELVALKQEAERQINARDIWEVLQERMETLWCLCQGFGVRFVLKRITYKLLRVMKVGHDPYTKAICAAKKSSVQWQENINKKIENRGAEGSAL